MNKFIDTIEWIAAIFVGLVCANIFLSVMLRQVGIQIPDAYDIGSLMLGVLIFWGIAATSYRGTHITVDLVWQAASPKWKHRLDIFATLVLLFVVIVQTYTLYDKVLGTYLDNVKTYDLRMPVWPFYAVAWVGDAAAVALIAIRTFKLLKNPNEFEQIITH